MRRVYEMVRYAYTNVPMYMRIADRMGIDVRKLDDEELWNVVPLVDKSEFVESGSNCISVKYISKLYRNELRNMCTSGSTGMYMDIKWDKADYNRSMMPLWILRSRYYDISPDDKMVYFFTLSQCGNQNTESEYKKNTMGISKQLLNNEDILKVYDMILDYNPIWMLLQPSVAIFMSNIKKEHNLPDIPSLKYIELTGEYISDAAKMDIRDCFNCNVANQYGCIEGNSIAYECPYGNMHLMNDNVYLETIDNKAYITTLTNHAMPFVKYGLGDSVAVDNLFVQCKCGSITPIIKVLAGRSNDYIKLPYDKVMNSSCIHSVFDALNHAVDGGILQYKVDQTAYNEFNVYIVVDEDNTELKDYIEGAVRKKLIEAIGYDVIVRVAVSKVLLPDEFTGKMKIFECLV